MILDRLNASLPQSPHVRTSWWVKMQIYAFGSSVINNGAKSGFCSKEPLQLLLGSNKVRSTVTVDICTLATSTEKSLQCCNKSFTRQIGNDFQMDGFGSHANKHANVSL